MENKKFGNRNENDKNSTRDQDTNGSKPTKQNPSRDMGDNERSINSGKSTKQTIGRDKDFSEDSNHSNKDKHNSNKY